MQIFGYLISFQQHIISHHQLIKDNFCWCFTFKDDGIYQGNVMSLVTVLGMCQDIKFPRYSYPYYHNVNIAYYVDTPIKLLPIFWHLLVNTPFLGLCYSFQFQSWASYLLANWCTRTNSLKNMSKTPDYRPIYWKIQPNLLKILQCHTEISYNEDFYVFIWVPWFSKHTPSMTIHSLNGSINIIWEMNWMYQF